MKSKTIALSVATLASVSLLVACQFLSAQGLTVINVEGGMNAWPDQVE